jgi:hypothetical protein
MVLTSKRNQLDTYSRWIRATKTKGNIIIHKEACEIIQKIGKIEELQVIGGIRVRIVVLRAIIGAG